MTYQTKNKYEQATIELFITRQQNKLFWLYLEASQLVCKLYEAKAKETLIEKAKARSDRRLAEYKALVKVAREIQ